MDTRIRKGQSLIELLVGIAVGAIFIIGAAAIIVPSLKVGTQAENVQMQAQLGQELLNNVRAWANGNWNAVLATATGTANHYYLNAAASPFTVVGNGGAVSESVSSCGAASVAANYLYSRVITINPAMVSSTDQTNFPVLFSGTYSYLATVASGGNVTNANGYDIIFTSDSAGNNLLPFEQENYSSSTGTVNYWINVPTVSHSVSTTIYLWYGNPNVTTSQANASGVWSSGYEGVYHFPNGTTLSANDSTVNADTGTVTGVTATTGKIDGGANFGNPGYITLLGLPNYAVGDFMISTWANFSSLPAYNAITVGKSQLTDTLFISTQSNGQGLRMGRTNDTEDAKASFTWSTSTWYYVALTRVGGVFKFYVNGVPLSTTNEGGSTFDYVNTNNDIGGDGGSYPMYGSLDEFRILNAGRSAGWIATEYNNQNSPSTFYSVGSATTPSGGGSAATTCTTYNRYFYLSDVYRDSNGNVTSTTSSNYYDPSTKLATVVIGIASSTAAPLTYPFYITRSGGNVLSQTTWAGGSGQTGPVTFVSSTYAAATSVSVNVGGSIQLTSSGGGSCSL